MATKCHKTGSYLFEQFAGMTLFRMERGRKLYRAKCSRCGRLHELSEKEARQ